MLFEGLYDDQFAPDTYGTPLIFDRFDNEKLDMFTSCKAGYVDH
jgi:hypothetical protein